MCRFRCCHSQRRKVLFLIVALFLIKYPIRREFEYGLNLSINAYDVYSAETNK